MIWGLISKRLVVICVVQRCGVLFHSCTFCRTALPGRQSYLPKTSCMGPGMRRGLCLLQGRPGNRYESRDDVPPAGLL